MGTRIHVPAMSPLSLSHSLSHTLSLSLSLSLSLLPQSPYTALDSPLHSRGVLTLQKKRVTPARTPAFLAILAPNPPPAPVTTATSQLTQPVGLSNLNSRKRVPAPANPRKKQKTTAGVERSFEPLAFAKIKNKRQSHLDGF